MLSCKEIVKIVSSEEDSNLQRKVEVRLHLMMCVHCGRYARQLQILKQSLKKLFLIEAGKVDSEKIRSIEENVLKNIKK